MPVLEEAGEGGACPGCLPGGCLPGGCLPGGIFPEEGVCPERGVCLGGVHPPVNRITDMCKNITFRQLHLRAVISLNRSDWPFKANELLRKYSTWRIQDFPEGGAPTWGGTNLLLSPVKRNCGKVMFSEVFVYPQGCLGLFPGGSLCCPGEFSVQCGLCSWGVSVKGGFCPGGLCPGRGVSVQGGLCPGRGVSVREDLCPCRGVSVTSGDPLCILTSGMHSFFLAYFLPKTA